MKELYQLILEEKILTRLDLACKKIRQYLLCNVIIVYVCF